MAARRCDICQFKDGWRNLKLVECHRCKVSVHRECYGLTPKAAKDFQESGCLACRSVGKTIRGRNVKGEDLDVVQDTRPQTCVLCNIRTGVHGMHPLYNTHGRNGKQRILRSGKLAWVHTLCALAIGNHNTTRGCVYGCDIKGDYESDETEGKRPDEAREGGDDDSVVETSTHHFCIIAKEDKNYWRVVVESRALKCIDCGKVGTKALLIPVQCNAGDEHEFEEFRDQHGFMKEPCMEAFHIGCAMWGTQSKPRRVYFFPGTNDKDPQLAVYCPLHSHDVDPNKSYHPKQKPAATTLEQKGSRSVKATENRGGAGRLKRLPEGGETQGPRKVPKRESVKMHKPPRPSSGQEAPDPIALRSTKDKQKSALGKHPLSPKRGSTASQSTALAKNMASTAPKMLLAEKGQKHVNIDALLQGSVPRNSPSPAINKRVKTLGTKGGEAADLLLAPDLMQDVPIRMPLKHRSHSEGSIPLVLGKHDVDGATNVHRHLKAPGAKRSVSLTLKGMLDSQKKVQGCLESLAKAPAPPYAKSMSLIKPPAYKRQSDFAAPKKDAHPEDTLQDMLSSDSDMLPFDAVGNSASSDQQTRSNLSDLPEEHSTSITSPEVVKGSEPEENSEYSVVANSENTNDDKDESQGSFRAMRRSNISESKTDDNDRFSDDFDWLGAMVRDLTEVASILKRTGGDLDLALEARRQFWKKLSRIRIVDFRPLWQKVEDRCANLLNHEKMPKNILEGNISVQVAITDDVGADEVNRRAAKNRWSNIWRADSALFDFGDWDTSEKSFKMGKRPRGISED